MVRAICRLFPEKRRPQATFRLRLSKRKRGHSSFRDQKGRRSEDRPWVSEACREAAGKIRGRGVARSPSSSRWRQTGQWWVALSTGSSFTSSLWATWNPAVTWVDIQVGDFNWDGKDDITGRFLQGGSWWTGASNGSA